MDERRYGRLGDWLWLLACGLLSSAWCLSAAGQLGASFDEPLYLKRGLERWRTGSYAGLMRLGTMPLPIDVETLPLYLWERARGVPFDPELETYKLLPVARAAALTFWWLLLLYGMLIGRHLAGPWGGRLAVVLLACEPTLLAHASLATTDIAITACLLAFAYHFCVGRDAGWSKRVGVPAVWFALAVLAKASGLVFGPLCMAVIELHRYASSTQPALPAGSRLGGLWAHIRSCRRDFFQIIAGGLLLVFVYVGSDWRAEPSFVKWANTLDDGAVGTTTRWLAANLHIFSNAGEGLVQQIKHNIRSHGGTYLLGEQAPRAFWYYFPVALTIKLSVALLLLPLLVALTRPKALLNWACLCALVLLVFSLNCRVQIGVRLVLPLVGLAVVGLAAAAVQAAKSIGPGWRRSAFAGLVGVGTAWTVVAAIDVWPQGLCYVNEFWGGPEDGYILLSDSNYDWGQGLPDLARWQKNHAEAPLDVWYFGSDPTVLRLPVRAIPLHSMPIQGPDDVRAQVAGRYLAVSTTLLYGRATDMPGHRNAAAFLRTCVPAARTATFLIYDFTSAGTGPAPGTAPATGPPSAPSAAGSAPAGSARPGAGPLAEPVPVRALAPAPAAPPEPLAVPASTPEN